MPTCAAVDCKNPGTHVFPKDVKRRKLWERALRRKNWKPNNTSRLCAIHFKPEDFFLRNSYTGDENIYKRLRKTAVPSIFSFTKVKPVNPLAEERSNRLLQRNEKKLCFDNYSDQIAGPSHVQTLDSSEEQYKDEEFTDFNEIELFTSTPLEPDDGPEQRQHTVSSKNTQVNFVYIYGSIQKYKDNDSVIAFYTGFESYQKFYFVFSTLSLMAHRIKYYGSQVQNISIEDQFFMTMMKIRQNKCNFELAQFFETSPTTVYNIFITWINFMDQLWKKLNIWPDKDIVNYYMPDSFKQYDKNTRFINFLSLMLTIQQQSTYIQLYSYSRVILDGTEIKIQKPGNPISQQASWSSYKHSNTLKVLVGATPGGLLSYCSPAYGGSISDRRNCRKE